MSGIALGFVGDVCLAGAMRPALLRGGPAHCLELAKPLFEDRDLVCANFEFCIVSDDVDGSPKNVMQVPRSLADGIGDAGIGVWSLCNNHVLDAGAEGLASTLRFLDERGQYHFGAGASRGAAERLLVVDVRGRSVGFSGACDVHRHFASGSAGGVAPLLGDRLLQRVAEARKEVDVVVCALHADLEFSRHPAPGRVRLSRALIECGADLVVQHHPHVCQGIERHGNGLIAYSLGNFVFPVAGDRYQDRFPATKWSVVLCVDVEWRGRQRSLSWRVEPVTLGSDGRPSPSIGTEREGHLATMAEVSKQLADRTLLRREWWMRCVQEARSTYYVLQHCRSRAGVRSALAEAVDLARNPYERRWMYGLLTGGTAG